MTTMDNMISDVNSHYVLDVNRLRTRQYRRAKNQVIVEGYPEVSRAVRAKVPVERVFICPEIFTVPTDEFSSLNIVLVTKEVFAKMAFGSRLKGILAICKPVHFQLDDIRLGDPPFLVVMDQVEKPGNLGAVIRSCDGAGVNALIMTGGKTDIYNHNVVRSSIGTIFTVPTLESTQEKTFEYLNHNNINIFAATAKADHEYTREDFSRPTAIILGNEHAGVSSFWLEHCHNKIRIPMHGEATSLNVTVSASILIYEILRQRTS